MLTELRRTHHVRLAEAAAVLDTFSRGRAGVAVVPAPGDGALAASLVDYLHTAWSADDFAYADEWMRFPSSATPADTKVQHAAGVSAFVPQWERGGDAPPTLTVTPKPHGTIGVHVDISDGAGLDWVARAGLSPFVCADVDEREAVGLLQAYDKARDAAGHPPWRAAPTLERRFDVVGTDERDSEVADWLVALRAEAHLSGFVWRRTEEQTGDRKSLRRLMSAVFLPVQA